MLRSDGGASVGAVDGTDVAAVGGAAGAGVAAGVAVAGGFVGVFAMTGALLAGARRRGCASGKDGVASVAVTAMTARIKLDTFICDSLVSPRFVADANI